MTFLPIISSAHGATSWDAGADLAANEVPNGNVNELSNPNGTFPEWSYGFRAAIAATELLNFGSMTDHTDSFGGSPSLQGWTNAGGLPGLAANVSTSAVTLNFGFSDLLPIAPNDMVMHPGSGFAIVARWTAPFAGTYTVNALWEDLDSNGGNGATGALVLDGTLLASGTWANGGGFTDARVLNLTAGQLLDFVVDPNGDPFFDNTRLNATIVVPEPSTPLLLSVLGGCLMMRRRRR